MIEITIFDKTPDRDAMADLLRHIADQLDNGMVMGFAPGWETTGTEETPAADG